MQNFSTITTTLAKSLAPMIQVQQLKKEIQQAEKQNDSELVQKNDKSFLIFYKHKLQTIEKIII